MENINSDDLGYGSAGLCPYCAHRKDCKGTFEGGVRHDCDGTTTITYLNKNKQEIIKHKRFKMEEK